MTQHYETKYFSESYKLNDDKEAICDNTGFASGGLTCQLGTLSTE